MHTSGRIICNINNVLIVDEETGRCVGNFKVAIRRRWNYENTVSAIVCYMCTRKFFLANRLST